MSRELYFGFDPDLSTSASACVDDTGRVLSVRVFRTPGVPKSEKTVAACLEVWDWVFKTVPQDLLDRLVNVGGVAIEGQEIAYTARTGRGANPRDMIPVAQVAGAAMAAASRGPVVRLLPRPAEWKGQVPKGVHQARTYRALGWQYEMAGGKSPYAVPSPPANVSGVGELLKSDWKHVGDAIGLALWCKGQCEKQRRLAA